MAQVEARQDTLSKLLRQNYLRWGDKRVAMRHKDFGIWQQYTWKDEYENVKYFSLGLMSLGLKPGGKVATIGENEPEQFWAIFATQAARGIPLAIFPDTIDPEIEYIVTHSDATFVVSHDQEQCDKLLRIKDKVPKVKKVIWWEPKGMWDYDDPWLISFEEVKELGKKYEEEHSHAFEESIEQTKPDDYAFFYYTSGTTGLPKGAMLTYKSAIATMESIARANPINEDDDALDYISPAWIGEPLYGSMQHLVSGIKLNFPEKPETLMGDLRELSPGIVGWAPRQWENIASMVQVKMNDAGLFKRLPYRLFLPIGYRVVDMSLEGKKLNLLWKILGSMANALCFSQLRDKLGFTKNRLGIVGGYTLGIDTFRYLRALGINLCQFYAITEGGFISIHYPGRAKAGTIGELADYVEEIKTTEDGELAIKSPGLFSGYYKNPEATAQVLRDGWFYTGDAVYRREDGHLVFIDRASELGKLKSGAKFSPQFIESQLRFGGYIKDAMVLGDEEKEYVAAIINIDFESVGKWAEKQGVPYTTFVDLSQKPEVARLVLMDIERVNKSVPEPARVSKFVLLHKEFDPDEAELTRTRKLRRRYMEGRYKDLIDAIYSAQDEFMVESGVTYHDGRSGTIRAGIKINQVSPKV